MGAGRRRRYPRGTLGIHPKKRARALGGLLVALCEVVSFVLVTSTPAQEIEPDTTPPQTRIQRAPPERSADRSPRYKFEAVDLTPVAAGEDPEVEEDASFVCRLDLRPWQACSSPQRYQRLWYGRHAFRVRATDSAGNPDPTPARDSFLIVRPSRR